MRNTTDNAINTPSAASMAANSNVPALRMQDVHKRFGQNEVLRGISLQVQKGEVVAILGASGSGKSTLLRCINHLETIDSGSIDVDIHNLVHNGPDGRAHYANEHEIRHICSHSGMVFQHFNLFPHMTVLENLIEAPMTVKKLARSAIVPQAEELLRKVGLFDKRDAYPARLSGGQKQRVAIARALAMQPAIMLFDEPTSALDPELTIEVLRTMRQLAAEHTTMLVVTHEMAFAREVAHRVLFMDSGVIVEDRPAQEFFANPQHPRACAFLQHML